jgi:hypothetical protein
MSVVQEFCGTGGMFSRTTCFNVSDGEFTTLSLFILVLPSTESITNFVDSLASSSKNAGGKNAISLHHQSMQQNAVFFSGSPRSSIKNQQEAQPQH